MPATESTSKKSAQSSMTLYQRYRRNCYVLAILVVLGTLVQVSALLFREHWWRADLLCNFLLAAIVIASGVSVLLATIRAWRWLAVTVLCTFIMLPWLPEYWQGSVAAVAASDHEHTDLPKLSVLSWNVLSVNNRYQDAQEVIAEGVSDGDGSAVDYDVVVLYEVTRQWTDALTGIHQDYPYRWLLPRGDNYGMAIYSRWPIRRVVPAGAFGTVPLFAVDIEKPDQVWRLFAVHTLPPLTPGVSAQTVRLLQNLIEKIRHGDARQPTVIVGDFNATPTMTWIRMLVQPDVGLRRIRFGSPWRTTWAPRLLPTLLAIDHAFINAAVRPLLASAGPRRGADHRPLKLLLAAEGKEN